MNRTDRYLVLDQGSHASRAMIFDAGGQALASRLCPVSSRHPRPGRVEHDPEEVVASLQQAMEGVAADGVGAAGLATQRSSVVCWNRRTGRALSPVISWQDRRATDWMDRFSTKWPDIQARTGLFPSAHYGAGKLAWCLNHLPAVRKALKDGDLAWGPLAGFLLFRLLRERPLCVDAGNASRTLLWNIRTLDWDPFLLELFSLPAPPLPRCVPSCHDFGCLDVAGRKVPLKIVMGDLPAALFASGLPQPDIAYINVGTGAFVQRLLRAPPEGVRGFLRTVAYQDAHACVHALEGTVNGAGCALAWFEERCGIHDITEHLPEWLQREVEPPLFLNGVAGLGSPFWKPAFESRFVGEGKAWQRAVAIVESIAFLLQFNLEGMNPYTAPVSAIRISGGLASMDGLCQRLANLSGIPVMRSAQAEATARGCAFLLAESPDGWYGTDTDEPFQPYDDAGLKRRYARWRTLMPQHH